MSLIFVGLAYLFLGQNSEHTGAEFNQVVPIKFLNLGENLIATANPSAITLKINAPQSVWNRLKSDDFEVVVDLSELNPGESEQAIKLSAKNNSVSIESFEPKTVLVTIELIETKIIPIQVELAGTIGQNLVAKTDRITPKETSVRGPKRELERLTTAVASVDLTGVTDDFNRKSTIRVPSNLTEQLTQVNFDPTDAQVYVSFQKVAVTKLVGLAPRLTGRLQTGYYISGISVEPEAVSIQGAADQLDQISRIELPAISLDDLENTVTRLVPIELPPEIELTVPDQQATIKLEVSANTIDREVSLPLNFTGLATNLKIVSYSPLTVRTVLTGPVSELKRIDQNQSIAIGVDLSHEITPGQKIIDLTDTLISAPENIRIIAQVPSAVTVVLEIATGENNP